MSLNDSQEDISRSGSSCHGIGDTDCEYGDDTPAPAPWMMEILQIIRNDLTPESKPEAAKEEESDDSSWIETSCDCDCIPQIVEGIGIFCPKCLIFNKDEETVVKSKKVSKKRVKIATKKHRFIDKKKPFCEISIRLPTCMELDGHDRVTDIFTLDKEFQASLREGKLDGKVQELEEIINGGHSPEDKQLRFHFFLRSTGILSALGSLLPSIRQHKDMLAEDSQ